MHSRTEAFSIMLIEKWILPSLVCSHSYASHSHAFFRSFAQRMKDYNKAIQITPNYASAFISRGNLYDDMKMYDKAISDYNAAIKSPGNSSMAYNNLGVVHQNLNVSNLLLFNFLTLFLRIRTPQEQW
jgi:tetratricopeptide (TPR) repeat protein